MSQPGTNELSPDLAALVSSKNPSDQPADLWRNAIDVLRRRGAKPVDYRAVWGRLFQVTDVAQVSFAPLWFPDDDALRHSNLARWMSELRIDRVADFHRWSVEQSADFWYQAVRRLGIVFDQPAQTVVDLSQGQDRAIWFPGARLNIVASCFQADTNQIAVLSQTPGQPIMRTTYGELRRQTNQVSNSIRRAGWKSGDRLAVVLPMTAWSVPIYLGIIQAGCAVVSIADSFAPEEIANRLRIAEAKAVITYDRLTRAGKPYPWRRRRTV